MQQRTAQHFFDNAIRSQHAWRFKAARLHRAGISILRRAAAAKEGAESFCSERAQFAAEEDDVFEEFMEFEVGLLLLALCVENLLKGLWCGKNHAAINSVTNQRHLAALADPTSKLTTHNLGEIARATGVDLSASEFDALDALEGIIMWEGRYPTPLTVTDYHKYFQHGGPISKFFAGPSIFTIPLPVPPVIEAIIEKINEELNLIPDSARF